MVELFSDAFRGASLVLLGMFGYAILRFERNSFRKAILLVFLLTFVGFLLAYWDLVRTNGFLYKTAFFLSVQLPLAFWLLSKSLFDDNFRWNWKYGFLSVSAPVILYLLYESNSTAKAGLPENFRFLPYLISVLFIVLAFIESIRNREDDLVLSRLKKRNVFVLFSSLLALLSIYFFFTRDPLELPGSYELIQNATSCLFILWFFGSQFSYRNLFSQSVYKFKEDLESNKDGQQKRLIDKLLTVFEKEELFTREGMTISNLAEHMGEKEYLLRRAINGELGYTNFNSFLNHYRIQEARHLMEEHSENKLTFQEIAYRMGYQSVATFNRAFKKETGLTPTEFRNQLKSLTKHQK